MLSALVRLRPGDILRSYSVWDADPARGWLDLPVHGVHQAGAEGDHLDLPRPLTRIVRDGTSAASSRQLAGAVADLTLPDTPGVAYLAGEARTIQLIRSHLIGDRGWDRRRIITRPFWTPGRRGMD